MIRSINAINETVSIELATCLAANLTIPAIFTFSGEIGSGKTTFIRALLRALNVFGRIKSPTFSLVESYNCHHGQIHHFDLYRMQDDIELEYIGFRDYFTKQTICCIEWPENTQLLITSDLHFTLTVIENGRLITIESKTAAGEKMLFFLMNQTS